MPTSIHTSKCTLSYRSGRIIRNKTAASRPESPDAWEPLIIPIAKHVLKQPLPFNHLEGFLLGFKVIVLPVNSPSRTAPLVAVIKKILPFLSQPLMNNAPRNFKAKHANQTNTNATLQYGQWWRARYYLESLRATSLTRPLGPLMMKIIGSSGGTRASQPQRWTSCPAPPPAAGAADPTSMQLGKR